MTTSYCRDSVALFIYFVKVVKLKPRCARPGEARPPAKKIQKPVVGSKGIQRRNCRIGSLWYHCTHGYYTILIC
jgi:hypothetical protein